MKRINYLLILGLFALTSCQNDYERNNLQSSLNELKIGESITKVLVLEQSGCSTCLYKADEFFEGNRDNPDILYVFSGYSSLKRVRLKYKLNGEETNVIIDEGAAFYKNQAQLDYPSIIYLKSGKIQDYELASTNNFSAYARLKGEMSQSIKD